MRYLSCFGSTVASRATALSESPTHPKPDVSDAFLNAKSRPMRSSLLSFIVFSALLLSLTYIALSTRRTKIMPPEATTTSTATAKCVIYDRPPRTGSTTIARTLRTCLRSKGYKHARSYLMTNIDHSIQYMLNSSMLRLSLVSQHICITPDDIKRLKERCSHLLLISSTTPMKDRLFSEVKYKMLTYNGNVTITEDHLERLRTILSRGTEMQEAHKVKYPYCKNTTPMRPSYALQPDYIVRSKHMIADLQPLLKAFGCPTEFKTENVHSASFDTRQLLSTIKLKFADVSHKEMTKLAEMNNRKGLEKALLF